MADEPRSTRRSVAQARARVESLRDWTRRTVLGRVWERMLEVEFVDRSVALAGKAFVSFFPLVIVVAAFVPPRTRSSILSTLTQRLGIGGQALVIVREAFTSSEDIRRATGVLGLVLTFFFTTSFTTALQRVYLRVWRRAPGTKVSNYTRGPAWLVAVLVNMAFLGGLGRLLGGGAGLGLFLVVSLLVSCGFWWFTAWFLLLNQVRGRVLVPTGLITGVAMAGYAVSATIWMPQVVSRNEAQFGFIGVALALVTWFSGAAICILAGAAAGAVLAEDDGPIGALVRGREPGLLVEGAPPSLPPPAQPPRLSQAFQPTEDDVTPP